jgi:hypothetical protein
MLLSFSDVACGVAWRHDSLNYSVYLFCFIVSISKLHSWTPCIPRLPDPLQHTSVVARLRPYEGSLRVFLVFSLSVMFSLSVSEFLIDSFCATGFSRSISFLPTVYVAVLVKVTTELYMSYVILVSSELFLFLKLSFLSFSAFCLAVIFILSHVFVHPLQTLQSSSR